MVDVVVAARFVDSVPLPITDALVRLAPVLAIVAQTTRLVAWNGDWYSSWLALAAWWFVCLAAPALFRYAFPILAALVLALIAHRQPPPLVTETVLQSAIADLTAVSCALPVLPSATLPPLAFLRAAAILTVPWLVLAHLVSSRILFSVIGTLLISHRAPWARILRSVLWRSAFIRTAVHTVQAFLTGQPLPRYVVSNYPTPTTPAPVPSLRFLFSVYENQRWWVGLDWTAALLPSERPSWCSPALHPVSPPSAFTLPDPATVYLPAPDGKSRIKRTAIWNWDEPEWRLLVHKQGSSLSRIERPPPTIDDSSPLTPSSSSTVTSSGSRFLKAAANKFKESSSTSSNSITSSQPSPPASSPSDLQEAAANDPDDSAGPFTDPDGWLYSDNKWENQSHYNGLGKYTRYRRWSRVAIVSEVVEVVSPGATGVTNSSIPVQSHKTQRSISSSPTTKLTFSSDLNSQSPESQSAGDGSTSTSNTAVNTAGGTTTPTPSSSSVSPAIAATTFVPEPDSPLRQRLRAALSKSSISGS